MILTDKILVNITNSNSKYYKSMGYSVKSGESCDILVSHLPHKCSKKILVKCDVCEHEKYISCQKYNKNISKYGIYSCSVNCSQFKIKMTNLEKYGNEKYVNISALREITKIKYDKITKEIKERGYINCIKCLIDRDINDFLIKNGRYKHVCRDCRNKRHYYNLNKNPHIKAWRSVLRGYLNRINVKKSDKTFNLLKYTPEELRDHISDLFIDDMSWDNYGSWHIDHIVHVTLFKEDTPCNIVNGLKNLRPLYSNLNISRHNNIDSDCMLIMNEYKTYIKDEYIK